MRTLLTRMIIVVSLVAGFGVVEVGAQLSSASASSVGSSIASIAQGQAGTQDSPANTYCNKYSAYWGDGRVSSCSSGYRSQLWCADFAAWAWRQAGVGFTYGSGGITAAAGSFYSWGVANKTWHPVGSYTPQPGDVAVYGPPGNVAHVGIVISIGTSGPNVINGDWGSPSVVSGIVKNQTTNGAGAQLSGYVSPTNTTTTGGGGGGGGGSSSVRTVLTSDGHLQLFQVSGGVVRQNWYSSSSGAVGGWTQSPGLGAQAAGTPAVVARPGQSVVDVFVRGGDGQVYETWYNWGNGAWGGWIGMGGAISSDLQAVATSDGHEQVFGTGNGVVKQNWFSPSNGAVGGWATSAGLGAQAAGTPAVVARPGQSVVDVFVRGGDGQVYETWYNWGNGAWGGWIGMGGAISSDLQAVATSDGHEQVFAGANGVAQNWFGPSNGAVGGWRAI